MTTPARWSGLLLAQLGILVGGLALLSSTSARAETRPLRLQHESARTFSASLLAVPDELPGSVHQAMLSQISDQMDENIDSFRHSLGGDDLAAGGGDGSGGLAFVAGLLGFFPGFGLGHLITGHIGGFLIFLVIDLLISGVFFVAFPVVAFAFWYVPSLIVILIERVVEAFSAANSATSPPSYADALPAPANSGRAPVQAGFKVFSF